MDAYYEFLRRRAELLKRLVSEASDVHDNSLSNVTAGLDYMKQETGRTFKTSP